MAFQIPRFLPWKQPPSPMKYHENHVQPFHHSPPLTWHPPLAPPPQWTPSTTAFQPKKTKRIRFCHWRSKECLIYMQLGMRALRAPGYAILRSGHEFCMRFWLCILWLTSGKFHQIWGRSCWTYHLFAKIHFLKIGPYVHTLPNKESAILECLITLVAFWSDFSWEYRVQTEHLYFTNWKPIIFPYNP